MSSVRRHLPLLLALGAFALAGGSSGGLAFLAGAMLAVALPVAVVLFALLLLWPRRWWVVGLPIRAVNACLGALGDVVRALVVRVAMRQAGADDACRARLRALPRRFDADAFVRACTGDPDATFAELRRQAAGGRRTPPPA